MAKAKADPLAKKQGESYFQYRSRIVRHNQNQRDRDQPPVTDEARTHGDYRTEMVVDEEGRRQYVPLNRGGTPVDRWKRDDRLSTNQIVAIEHCERLWRLASRAAPLTASYGERMPPGRSEQITVGEVEARHDLRRLEWHFKDYWTIFENVVRHGHASGHAGEGAGFSPREAPARVYQAVCMVADMVFDMERL